MDLWNRRSALLLGAISLVLVAVGPASPADRRATARLAGAAVTPVGQKPPPAHSSLRARPNDPLWRSSWSLAKVGAPGAWRLTAGAPQTVVAVLDTGVDRGHPDLQGAFVDGWDVVDGDADPEDGHGHGTMVAGVIAARGDNRIGAVGVCWRCSLMPVKVLDAAGRGVAADIAEGIVWATDHGASVINMSFALTGGDAAVEQAAAYAAAHGVLLVAAAGNAGTADVSYPAAYPGVLGVAATDSRDVRFPWSSYGSWVPLAAPGCSVTTAPAAGYAEFCGTSSAAAFVSGLAGLGRSYAPSLPAGTVDEALGATALRVGDIVSAGRIEAVALLAALAPVRGPRVARAPLPGRAASD